MNRVPAARLIATVVLAAVLPLAMACDSESALGPLEQPPTIATQFARVPAGTATMPLTVTNKSIVSWDYGACPHVVERLEPDGWHVAVPPPMLCNAVGFSVAPGESLRWEVVLPGEEGTYRVRVRFVHFPNNRAEDVFAVSNTFEIGDVASPED